MNICARVLIRNIFLLHPNYAKRTCFTDMILANRSSADLRQLRVPLPYALQAISLLILPSSTSSALDQHLKIRLDVI